MAFAAGCSMRVMACTSRRMLRSRHLTALSPRCRSTRLPRPALSMSSLWTWHPATGTPPASRAFALWRRRIKPPTRRSSRPTSPRATTVCANCSTPPTDAFTTPLSTAPIADRALPSFARYPMTERPRRWIAFPCAPSAPQSMATRLTGAFMRSPMPALNAGRTLRGARRTAVLCQRRSTQHQPSALRARPAMPSSNAASSCWPTDVSSPSRDWAGSTWPATPPTSRW